MKNSAQPNIFHNGGLPYLVVKTACMALCAFVFTAAAQAPPPAPSLVGPANGAGLAQPLTLIWNSVQDPDGPIGSYTWQVSASSAFGTIIAQGFQNQLNDTIPTPTHAQISGLPNGTYFWRVKATQLVGGAAFAIDSPWSQVRSFTVTALGPAPGTPSFLSPGNGAQFHPVEFFDIKWTPVPNAQYYLLEADDDPAFSYPLTLTSESMQFGTKFHAGWGNEIPNIYYRVRAVSVDNVRGLPSPTLTVHVVNTAPVPPPPTPLSPVGGTTVSMPIMFDWSDTPNPQIPGYDLDIDDEPNFLGDFGVTLVQNISRSDYLLAEDQDFHLAPGTYFWRVRAVHGDVVGPWSAGSSFTVVDPPATPPGLEIFWIIAEPGTVYGGNPGQARVTLNMPAGPGGALVRIASDFPHVEVPPSVLVPEGKTDATVSPITTIPVPGASVGDLRAAYANRWQQSSIGLFPILWGGLSLSDEAVVGGQTITGTVTLPEPAPSGGVEVTVVSDDTSLALPPAKVVIPAGGRTVTFAIPTAPVSFPTRVVFDSGTAFEGFHAPANWLTLLPAGSPVPAASLRSLSLSSPVITSGGTTTGTVTLTAPAPAGGVLVRLNGSLEGQVITPQNVTVPAGSLSAIFTMTAPQVDRPRYVFIQGNYGTTGGAQAALLEIDPGSVNIPTLLAMGVASSSLIGGNTDRGTVGLVAPAPAGGGLVALTSDDPSLVQVPASVTIAAGNSADSFTMTTAPVAVGATVRITATAGGVTKESFINLGPDPNAPPPLRALTVNPTSVTGGTAVTGTAILNSAAPAGGASITLSTSNPGVAQSPPVITVPAGQISATFTISTFQVSKTATVTITGFYGSASQSVTFTVGAGASQPPVPGTPTLLNPADAAQVTQPIALDWSDASNAASYEIQVDDSSTFSAPLVRSLTSTPSQTSVTGLSSVTHWWRVRARNSSGVAGNWSASRRFTPVTAPTTTNLLAVSANPASVVGGNTSQGTVTLSDPAPVGGALVTLSSSQTAAATVPANVTVSAGATSAGFTITSKTVTASTSAIITATLNSVSKTATLTINPAAAGPLPAPSLVGPGDDARFKAGQQISFDWSDVAGATGYTFQIDDRNGFTAPLILTQTTTVSNFSTSTLARADMWWRVRANDSAGNPGAWSTARRFRVE